MRRIETDEELGDCRMIGRNPPSTVSVAPVVEDDASEASQTAASATSSEAHARHRVHRDELSRSSGTVTTSVRPPSITPGARQFARMPAVAYSTAIVGSSARCRP